MNRPLCLLVLFLAASRGLGAPFRNLGFDDADLSMALPGPPLYGRTEDFLPGWQLFSGQTPVLYVGVNLFPPGLDYATLVNEDGRPGGVEAPVEGRFSLDLVPGIAPGPKSVPYTLSQRGDIPQGARALHFLSYDHHLELSLNGTEVPLVYVPRSFEPLEINDVYADISAFAGQTVSLELTTLLTDRPAGFGIDSISFVVPEPSSWLLLGVGLGGLIVLKRACLLAECVLPSGGRSRQSRTMPGSRAGP